MKISAFSTLRNEAKWVGYATLSILPYVDQIVWYDGSSNDGTLELLKKIQKMPGGDKVQIKEDVVFENTTKGLIEDYNVIFNDMIQHLEGEWALFWHSDCVFVNPEQLRPTLERFDKVRECFCLNVNTEAFYGDTNTLMETHTWPIIFRNCNEFHHEGGYGAPDEDFYWFMNNRRVRAGNPIITFNTELQIHHYRNLKPYPVRLERMAKCFQASHPEWTWGQCLEVSKQHPWVDETKLNPIPHRGEKPKVLEQYQF